MDANTAYLLFSEFLVEGFDVLNVKKEDRLYCCDGIVMVGENAAPIHINAEKKTVHFCSSVFVLFTYGKDTPTTLRMLAYSTANQWKRSLDCGRLLRLSNDDYVAAMAISTIKGLHLFGHEMVDPLFPKVRTKVREFTGLDIMHRKGICKGAYNKHERDFIVINNDNSLINYVNETKSLVEQESVVLKTLPRPIYGNIGSPTNPFGNVDDAAEYLLNLEKERLNNDAFRRRIVNMPYFVDIERQLFRIPWASAFCAYYDGSNVNRKGFVVNQLQSGRFNFKPSLCGHKFLFRGQSEYFDPCVPNIYRKKDDNYFLKYTIFTCEMQLLMQSHPLVKLFDDGFELFNDYFRIEVNYGGLSQHYYNRTNFLDLTSEIDAAKFFAVTTFDFGNNKYVKYTGNKLGVMYYYDIEPDAFIISDKRPSYQLSAIGKQPFMRSGAQHGFLLAMEPGINFNTLPQVGCIFFKHDSNITDRIYRESNEGEKYQSDDILQQYWYGKLRNPDESNRVCIEAVLLNHKHNPDTSELKLIQQLNEAGIKVHRDGIPSFSDADLNRYHFSRMPDAWNDFCKDIYFYSPEGRILHQHLLNLPNHPRYRHFFFR